MSLDIKKLVEETFDKMYNKKNSEWFEEGDKELSEEETKQVNELFDAFVASLDETGKSQFAGKLIGLGVLKKDEKTGKLVKGSKDMSTQQAIDRLEKGK